MNDMHTIVLSVDGRLDPEAVACALWTDAEDSGAAGASAARSGDATHRVLTDAPALLDRSLLETYAGSERTHLEEEERAVLDLLRSSTRALPGESTPAWSMGALAAPWLHLRGGTVVCRRQSSVADMMIALPNLHVDRRTGQVRLGALRDEHEAPSLAATDSPSRAASSGSVRVDGVKDDEAPPKPPREPNEVLKTFIEAGMVALEFVGVALGSHVMEGGFAVFHELVGLFFRHSTTEPTLSDTVFKSVQDALAVEEQKVALATFRSFMKDATRLIAIAKADKDAVKGSSFRKDLEQVAFGAHMTLLDTLQLMEDGSASFDLTDKRLTELDTNAFRAWRYGTGALLLHLKLQWMLEESVPLPQSGVLKDILDTIDDFDAFAKKVSDGLAGAVDRRLALITPVRRDQRTEVIYGPTRNYVVHKVGVDFRDDGGPVPKDFFYQNEGCKNDKEQWTKANARRDKRVDGVRRTRLARLRWEEEDDVTAFRKQLATLRAMYEDVRTGKKKPEARETPTGVHA